MILSQLAQMTTEARAHYQVWWAIAHHGPIEYERALARFSDFFETTRVANLTSMIMAAWKPFDGNSQAASFQSLVEKHANLLDATDTERIHSHISVKPGVTALHKLRHLYFSHRNAKLSADEIFNLAGITPDQLRDIIEESADIIRNIQRKQGITSVVFSSNRGLRSTIQLLKAVQAGA